MVVFVYLSGECLNAHNALRNLHVNTPNMTWSDDLAVGAQEMANKLVYLAKNGVTDELFNMNYGENIYGAWWQGCNFRTCSDAVLRW